MRQILVILVVFFALRDGLHAEERHEHQLSDYHALIHERHEHYDHSHRLYEPQLVWVCDHEGRCYWTLRP
jgi:hypothetical protein